MTVKSNTKPTEFTDHHKLYIKEAETRVKDGYIINYTKYDLYLTDFDHDDNLMPIIHQLQSSTGTDDICNVYIQSPGGSSDQGIALSDCLKTTFHNRLDTEILYQASSMGSLIFCIGNNRIVNINSRNMMHNYSSGFSGKASDIKTRVSFFDDHLTSYIKKLYLDSGFLTKSEFKKMQDGKEYWFTASQMLERGIATHLRAEGNLWDKKEAKRFL